MPATNAAHSSAVCRVEQAVAQAGLGQRVGRIIQAGLSPGDGVDVACSSSLTRVTPSASARSLTFVRDDKRAENVARSSSRLWASRTVVTAAAVECHNLAVNGQQIGAARGKTETSGFQRCVLRNRPPAYGRRVRRTESF